MATYNLIHSVKGGCGKTTFSLWLAYYLEKSLLIDMDLLGTSMQVLVYGNEYKSQDTAYTNDVFQGVKNSRKKFVEKVSLSNNKCIHVVFSSMDYKEKDRFKAGKHSGYTPVVKHSMFRLGLRELLKHNKTLDGEVVEHFIFDMPPNSDGFSDAAMECIFNSKYSDLKGSDMKNLFMMIGADWGQTVATINELKTLLLHGDDSKPNRIFLVINHNLGDEFIDTDYDIRKKEIETALKNWSIKEETKNNIFFLKMEHNEHYTKLGIAGKALKNAESDEIDRAFEVVISAYADFGETFKDMAADHGKKDKLRKLILGEEDEENDKA